MNWDGIGYMFATWALSEWVLHWEMGKPPEVCLEASDPLESPETLHQMGSIASSYGDRATRVPTLKDNERHESLSCNCR
jgi:hypothetical protein